MESNTPITMSRRHVLGDIAARCEPVLSVPVYLNETRDETIGYAEESPNNYRDAITFHLQGDACKKLVSGNYTYSFDLDFAGSSDDAPTSKRRVRLNSIHLIERKGYAKPLTKDEIAAAAAAR